MDLETAVDLAPRNWCYSPQTTSAFYGQVAPAARTWSLPERMAAQVLSQSAGSAQEVHTSLVLAALQSVGSIQQFPSGGDAHALRLGKSRAQEAPATGHALGSVQLAAVLVHSPGFAAETPLRLRIQSFQ